MSEIKRLREPVEHYLTPGSSEGRQLNAARNMVDAIWDEHEATAYGNKANARSALSVALEREPSNVYIRFLERKQLAIAKQGLSQR